MRRHVQSGRSRIFAPRCSRLALRTPIPMRYSSPRRRGGTATPYKSSSVPTTTGSTLFADACSATMSTRRTLLNRRCSPSFDRFLVSTLVPRLRRGSTGSRRTPVSTSYGAASGTRSSEYRRQPRRQLSRAIQGRHDSHDQRRSTPRGRRRTRSTSTSLSGRSQRSFAVR